MDYGQLNVGLDGRTVIVTGGSRGIGRAIVLSALSSGAKVLFCAREETDDARDVLARGGEIGDVAMVCADVSNERGIDVLFDAATERFGGFDAVIANAAIAIDRIAVQMSVEEWDRVVQTNLTGPFLLARRAVRDLTARGAGGAIVLVSSISQNGAISQVNYAAAKGGLFGLCRSLAREVADRRIAVNVLVPGYVETSMSSALPESFRRALTEQCPLKRSGSRAEVAAAALFLSTVSPPAYSGQVLHVSGGLTEVPV